MDRQKLNNKANAYSKVFIQDNDVTFPITKEMFIQYIKQAYKDGYIDGKQTYTNNGNNGPTPVTTVVYNTPGLYPIIPQPLPGYTIYC